MEEPQEKSAKKKKLITLEYFEFEVPFETSKQYQELGREV